MRLRVGISLVTVAALSLPLIAQTRPNLAGKWEQVYEKSVPVRPAPTPAFPPTTISQDGNTITISGVATSPLVSGATVNMSTGQMTTVPRQGPREDFPYTMTYVCDDAEHPQPDRVPPIPTTTPQPTRPGAVVTTMTDVNPIYRAAWTGSQFVLTTRSTSQIDPPPPNFVPRTRTIKKTYSIDSDGFLVVETLTTYEPAAAGAAPPTPTRAVYRKIS